MKLINKDRLSTQVAELFVQPNISYWQICSLVENAPIIDPIHAAGGCYCWECEKNEKGHCLIMRGCSVIQMGFCGYGRRKENHENTHTTQDP